MRKELQRNIIHLLLGVITAGIILKLNQNTSLILFGLILIIGTILSEAILRGKKFFSSTGLLKDLKEKTCAQD